MRPAALGFAAAGRAKTPSLILVARGGKSAVAQVVAHVDGYLVTSAGDRPAGASDPARGLIVQNGKLPAPGEFDFLLLDEHTPASALLSEDLSYVLRAEVAMADSLLRALHGTPVDGLLVQVEGPMTVGSQVSLLRISGFAGKPLFVELNEQPSSSDLEVLREAGAVGIVVSADLGSARIAELRKAIDDLPPRRKPRRDEREPVAVVGQVAPTADDEDFEDDQGL